MHLQNFRHPATRAIANEICREYYDNSDQRVDTSRTAGNYVIGDHAPRTAYGLTQAVADRAASIDPATVKRGSKCCTMSNWCITAPREIADNPDLCREFFCLAYAECVGAYGPDNVIGGYVHVDEHTPHMHVVTVPVAAAGTRYKTTEYLPEGGKRGVWRIRDKPAISAAGVHPKSELRQMHERLDRACELRWGLKGLVLNGATVEGLTNKQYKARRRKEEELRERERRIAEREQAINAEVERRAQERAQSLLEPLRVDLQQQYARRYDQVEKLATRAYQALREVGMVDRADALAASAEGISRDLGPQR